MDAWNVLEWSAWLISAGLLLWMVVDATQVGREYDEDVLMSSREGELELVAERHDLGTRDPRDV